jgi:hypothetical protein
MKQLAYILMLLLLSAQVEDAWVAALELPSDSLADDSDEYLPAQRQPRHEQSGFKVQADKYQTLIQAIDFSVIRMGVPPEWNLTKPFTPPPLYVFMSLQI